MAATKRMFRKPSNSKNAENVELSQAVRTSLDPPPSYYSTTNVRGRPSALECSRRIGADRSDAQYVDGSHLGFGRPWTNYLSG